MFTPSSYQTAIFQFIQTGRGDGIVNAVAGAGKSTVLVEAAKIIKGNALFVAFNKHIADSLNDKLRGTTTQAKTIHSVGNGALFKAFGKTRIDNQKYQTLCREWIAETFGAAWREQEERECRSGNDKAQSTESRIREAARPLEKLCNLARLTLTPLNVHALDRLAVEFGITIDYAMIDGVPSILNRGATVAQVSKIIDFTDMINLPVVLNLRLPTFDWVMVDERQDLNLCQLELVLRLRAPGGRYLFVGDQNQAIMRFAGADANTYNHIKTRTNITELPLSICYRCPTSHLDLARELVPEIEAAPNAPTGTIEHIEDQAINQHVQEGDLIICRMTAPLISLAIRLIAKRIPARVRGRDVAKELAALARTIADAGPWDLFLTYLTQYRMKQTAYLVQKEASEEQIQNLTDKCEALEVCYTSFQAESVEQLGNEIAALFADDRASVWLSTVHRAKGLEADRVFILRPDKLPLRWKGQSQEELNQELNLRYVALTRSKSALFFVEDKPIIVEIAKTPSEEDMRPTVCPKCQADLEVDEEYMLKHYGPAYTSMPWQEWVFYCTNEDECGEAGPWSYFIQSQESAATEQEPVTSTNLAEIGT